MLPPMESKNANAARTRAAGDCNSRLIHVFVLAVCLSLRQRHSACAGQVQNRNKNAIDQGESHSVNILRGKQRRSSTKAGETKHPSNMFAGHSPSAFAFFDSIGGIFHSVGSVSRGMLFCLRHRHNFQEGVGGGEGGVLWAMLQTRAGNNV